jgi:hypothetical protein
VRYWKGAYDEDRARDFELRRGNGLPTNGRAADDDQRDLGMFRALMAVQILIAAAALLSLVELLGNSR